MLYKNQLDSGTLNLGNSPLKFKIIQKHSPQKRNSIMGKKSSIISLTVSAYYYLILDGRLV